MFNIIGNDLCNFGYFELLFWQNMISQLVQVSEVIFCDWKVVGVNYVMVGNIVFVGGCLQVQYVLFDVGIEQQVLIGSVIGSIDQFCDMLYYIVDQLFEKFIGIKGVFFIKMFYVIVECFLVDNICYILQCFDYDGVCLVILLQLCEFIVLLCFLFDGCCIVYVFFEQKCLCIFIQYVDIGCCEQIINFEGLNGVLVFFFDGNCLVFVLLCDGNLEIYVMDFGSCVLCCLINNLVIDIEFFWGKDGFILYFILDCGGKLQIYKMNVNSGVVDWVIFIGNYNVNLKFLVDEKILVMVYCQQGYINFQIVVQDFQCGNLWVLLNIILDDLFIVVFNGIMLIYVICQQDWGVLMFVFINGCVWIFFFIVQGDVCEFFWFFYLN